ncbi:(E2-independent) E3 ubiquitin-conjugating enzyme FATS [Pseudochaenichthys georgianus]|uniref:(E2-independent) E3 ubiquitin-conjugating enzyme FATS n=1 Tax=Pseudochaenichthys georgianus TaxID=52239 RepID=UPI00146F3331|nr:(E2-independent) E3 ubiquitin-conjugating enzyme FATS [Pseudochaenichthys georgianus]
MTLRMPAAHLRRAPNWRKSADESYWESLIPEGEALPRVSRPPQAPRPQSAIEGRQLDGWLEHLQRIERELLRAPVHDQVPAFSDRTSSMPALHKEATGRAWRQPGIPSFSRSSSSCGSPSRCESSLGSQESLQTGFISPPEHRGSWERAHMMQAPKKEKAHPSNIAPVKIGWLPIQRRVMMVADACHQKFSDQSAGQLKLKQAITPTFQKNRTAANRHHDGEVERSHNSLSALGVKTWQSPDQESHKIQQVPEKQSFPAAEGDRPVGWQALRRAWNTKRVSVFPGGSQSNEPPIGTSSDTNRKPPLMKSTSIDPHKPPPPYRNTFADPCKPHTLLQGTSNTETNKSHAPLHRTSSVQPIRATPPLFPASQANSAVTTIIPQNKAGFSSITISSRKVCRSSSLPGQNPFSNSPSPPLAHQPMDPNSMQVTVQRKATIVKVTEQRMTSGPVMNAKSTTSPTSHTLDTVVHRRKATIIKVTEHTESYSPAKGTPRHPEYRHSYTEGVYNEDSMWSEENHSQHTSHHPVESTKSPNSAVETNTSNLNAEQNGGTLHRSSLKLFFSKPPAIAAPEVSPEAVGQRSGRPSRPLSCYSNMFGHTEPSEDILRQPAIRKWSFGLPQETNINPVNSDSVFSRPSSANEAPDAPNGGQKERWPTENSERRASPSLTLIQAPDPGSNQTQEKVLAVNAAAIIANIKLQRQLSKKKPPSDSCEKVSAASPQGNTDEGKCMKPHPDQRRIGCYNQPYAAFVSLSPDAERSPQTISLQNALQRSRPDFISRSQGRLRELERRAQERRGLAGSEDPRSDAAVGQRIARSGHCTSLNDNLLKPRDRAMTGREMQLRSKQTQGEGKRKKEEEKKREVCLTNRQRVELFKKKLLDQILQRSNS